MQTKAETPPQPPLPSLDVDAAAFGQALAAPDLAALRDVVAADFFSPMLSNFNHIWKRNTLVSGVEFFGAPR